MMKSIRLIAIGMASVAVFFNCSKLAESPTSPETVKCEVCHKVPPVDSMHRAGSRTDSCSQCHAGITISGATIRLDSTHNNGKIDVRCNNAKCHGFPVADTQPFHKARTLANLKCDSCHTGVYIKNGQIEALPSSHGLDSGIFTVNCISCHAVLPGGRPHANSSPTHLNCDSCHTGIIVNAGTISIREDHTVRPIKCLACHKAPPGNRVHDTTKKFNCDSCHIGIRIANNSYSLDSLSHDNGKVDLKCNGCHLTPPANKFHDTTKKYNCDSCHTGISIVNNAYSIDTATHDNGTINLKCNACHGFPPANRFHDTTKKANCADCHSGITMTGSTITQTALHNNGQIDVNNCIACHKYPPLYGNSHKSSGPTHVNCDSCHTRILVTNGVPILSQDHDTGTIKCIVCHAVPPAKGHDAAKKFNCDSCHTGIKITGNRYTLDSLLHGNGTTNINCDACHTFPPTDNAHPKHAQKKIACAVCHSGYIGTMVPPTPPPYHRGDTVVKFSSTYPFNKPGALFDSATKNCSAIYCHGAFPDGTNKIVNVNDKNTIGCGFCHDTASMFSLGHPRTDTLIWHRHKIPGIIRICSNCHDGYHIVAPVTTVDSTHVNGVYDVMVLDSTGKRVKVTPDANGHVNNVKQCIACHSNG